MARVNMSRMSLIYEHKGHKFYVDNLNQSDYLLHIDPKGREVDSACCDEEEAFDYIENKEN